MTRAIKGIRVTTKDGLDYTYSTATTSGFDDFQNLCIYDADGITVAIFHHSVWSAAETL